MKDCTHCKHANWERTKTGALHPSGAGMCTYEVKIPPLPASKHWIGMLTPAALGGAIGEEK